MSKRPGGELAARPLHFIWIADCSGSMSEDGKMQSLNNAIREAIPHMRDVANENPNAEIQVRVLTFSDGAQWHVSHPEPIASFKWNDLNAAGLTDMGKALGMLADQLKIPPMTDRALPPVLVLISDGQPTDDFDTGLKALMAQPWGKRAVRIAIAIGKDANLDVLEKFIGNKELKPLQANSPDALVKQIRFVSTAVLKSASSPASQASGTASPAANVPIPAPPVTNNSSPDDDVW
jgi:uncharacterized protein YegL